MTVQTSVELAEPIVDAVCQLSDRVSRRLLEIAVAGNWADLERGWKDGRNYLSAFDQELNDEYKRCIGKLLPAFLYVSEEQGTEMIPCEYSGVPEFIVIVDPLDTSELAVRGLVA